VLFPLKQLKCRFVQYCTLFQYTTSSQHILHCCRERIGASSVASHPLVILKSKHTSPTGRPPSTPPDWRFRTSTSGCPIGAFVCIRLHFHYFPRVLFAASALGLTRGVRHWVALGQLVNVLHRLVSVVPKRGCWRLAPGWRCMAIRFVQI
jgi:hypothetical protein